MFRVHGIYNFDLSVKKVPKSVKKKSSKNGSSTKEIAISYIFSCTFLLANEQILHPSKLTENAIALPNWLFSQFDSSIVAEAMLNIC